MVPPVYPTARRDRSEAHRFPCWPPDREQKICQVTGYKVVIFCYIKKVYDKQKYSRYIKKFKKRVIQLKITLVKQ